MVKKETINGEEYEIRLWNENGELRAHGVFENKPVTITIVINVLFMMDDIINSNAKNYETSTAKAIDELEIDNSTTLKDVYQAISSKWKLNHDGIEQRMISLIRNIIRDKAKHFYTGN